MANAEDKWINGAALCNKDIQHDFFGFTKGVVYPAQFHPDTRGVRVIDGNGYPHQLDRDGFYRYFGKYDIKLSDAMETADTQH